ncbi:MAG: Fic family protein [Devosia sp.]|nr:Fic family protein [Devosia sp.]
MNNRLRSNGRAGRYVAQPLGFSAFIPSALPPQNPPLAIDTEMQDLLSNADRALGRLDGSIQTLPNPDLFVLMYIRKEAVLSSQIEGTQSSLTDVLEAEANLLDARRPGDVVEVINYIDALKYGIARLPTLPISTRLIREIHEQLMSGVRGQERNPGEIRTSQNWIGHGGSTLNSAIFVPPPAHEVGAALSTLENFVHSNERLPVLVRIGLVHAQFETIHPFLDGNGRVGRLLITLLLCERQALSQPVLYISHYLRANRQRYYELLQAVRDHGAWEEWLKFFIEGIRTVSDEATETARRIVALREAHRKLITDNFARAAASALTLLEDLFKHPVVSVKYVAELLGMTQAGANVLVRRMVDAGLLIEITGNARNRAFRYGPYVDLF